MCFLGADLFKNFLNKTKWKIEIIKHLCLSELAQRFNSVNHVFFKDDNILLEVFRLSPHFFCDLAHEIVHNFFTTHLKINKTSLHLRGLMFFLKLSLNGVILLVLDNLLIFFVLRIHLQILHFHLHFVKLF